MFKTNSEKIFLASMLVIVIVAFGSLTGCALLDKLRGNHHVDGLVIPPNTIEVETPTTVEDVRG